MLVYDNNQIFFNSTSFIEYRGTSLVVHWLRLRALNTGGLNQIPGQGTRSHTPQLKDPVCCNYLTKGSQINKYLFKKKEYRKANLNHKHPTGMKYKKTNVKRRSSIKEKLMLKFLGNMDFPLGPAVKNPSANRGNVGLIPGLERFHMPWIS